METCILRFIIDSSIELKINLHILLQIKITTKYANNTSHNRDRMRNILPGYVIIKIINIFYLLRLLRNTFPPLFFTD